MTRPTVIIRTEDGQAESLELVHVTRRQIAAAIALAWLVTAALCGLLWAVLGSGWGIGLVAA